MAFPSLYRIGYQWYRNETVPDDGIIVYPGSCRSDDDTEDIVLTQVMYKTLNHYFEAGAGTENSPKGCADDVSLHTSNDTWHFIYAIKKTSTGAVDILVTDNVNVVTLPSGWNKKRMIGAIRRNNPNLQKIDTRFISGAIYVHYYDPVDNGLDWENNSGGPINPVGVYLKSIPKFLDNIYASVVFDANVVVGNDDEAVAAYFLNPDVWDAGASMTASPLACICTRSADEYRAKAMQLYANRDGVVEFTANSTLYNTKGRIQVLGYYWPSGANI